MKIKSIIIYCSISSLFLFSLTSIWKILATLQGLNIDNFNFQTTFFLGFIISFIYLIIGSKINDKIKSFIFAIIFTFIEGYLIQSLPIWYNVGIFLILYFFTSKIKKYNIKYFNDEYSSQLVFFDFLTLFGIVLFSFVILFPFYMMLVTSFKTQIALLVNPLDFSIDFNKDLKDLFKSYFVIFKTYKFGKFILTSSIVSIGTVIITLIFAIPAHLIFAYLHHFYIHFHL